MKMVGPTTGKLESGFLFASIATMAVSLAVSTNVTTNQLTTQPYSQKDTARRPRLCIAQQKMAVRLTTRVELAMQDANNNKKKMLKRR